MKAYERLLNYIQIDTPSDPESGKTPSTDCQFQLANKLVEELQALGVKNAEVDEKCYVYASVPATEGYEGCKKLGFIAHMDTAPDFNGIGVKPQIISNYDGKDVALGESGRVLRVKDFPELAHMKGRTLITTDGTSLLGSDDKSGIAEIMSLLEMILKENIPHGKICIGFTPDEEIGAGADHFDVEKFGADIAYTMDGGMEGEIEYENFNAAGATVKIQGRNIHPGYAKGKMLNAILIGMELNSLLPVEQRPEYTSGYEGFFHIIGFNGTVEQATFSYIIRDHDMALYEQKKAYMQKCVDFINEKYGAGTATVEIKHQYYNMRKEVEPHYHIVEKAVKAMEMEGIKPRIQPIRGGTDGANLSFMGLPCPNIFAGGHNFHGKMEFIPLESMEKASKVILNIIALYAE